MRPTLDVNRVLLNPRFRTALTLYRRSLTVDDYGRGQVEELEQTIGGVIRPATQRDLERLPEGDRDKGFLKVLTETPLDTGTDTAHPDEIEWDGKRWVVRTCDPWLFGRGFYSALCEMKAGSEDHD